MKIIIDFPDDVKPKYYSNLMNECATLIFEPKDWKLNCKGITIKEEPYLVECRKQKNISFKVSSRSKEYIRLRQQELNKKWEQDNYKWHTGTYTIEKED